MVEIIWDDRFRKVFKKWLRQYPELRVQFTKKIILFETDPFHPSLKTHTLSGVIQRLWSFPITYEYRLIFDFFDENTHK